MTILNCSATTCVYNKNQLCSRGGIEVTGSGARHADETCCGSFREQGRPGKKKPDYQVCPPVSTPRNMPYERISIVHRGQFTNYNITRYFLFSC